MSNLNSQESYLFAEFVHFRRKQFRLSQKKLAAMSGVDYNTISRIENCKGGLMYDTMRSILKALDCNLMIYAAWEKSHLENA